MNPANLHPQADEELSEISLYYESLAAGLGADFLVELNRTLAFLLQFPGAGRAIRHGSRRLSLRRFPYHLIYRVEPTCVYILAIAHHRRRPGYWRIRARPQVAR